MKKPVILAAKGISKVYIEPKPTQILRDITLDVSHGESLAIQGPSGIGKTTLLHIFGTLDLPTEGTLDIAGLSTVTACLPTLRNKYIGFVFQSHALFDDLTVLDNVLMPMRIKGRIGPEERDRARSLLAALGLAGRTLYSIKLLSGGEKQRVAIARALANDPPLLLADEPTGNLDRENAEKVQALLLSTCQSLGKAVIIATHDLAFAAACDRRLQIKDKTLVAIHA